MKHRIISNPFFFQQEALLINQLFDLGLPCLHLRKPQATLKECERLLKQINPSFYSQIILHQHPSLINKFDLMGLHLREGDRLQLTKSALINLIDSQHQINRLIGTSVHQLESLKDLPSDLDYALVSPVFPSISKQNYLPTEDWNIQQSKYPYKLIALGGIDLHTLLQTQAKGFENLAFLGAVWGGLDNVLENYKLLCKKMKMIDPLA